MTCWYKQPLSLPWFCVWIGKILILDVGLCISASTTTHPDVYCEKTLLKHSVKAQKNMEMEPFLIKLQERELERSCFGLTLTIFSGVTNLNKTCEGYYWLSNLVFLRLFWNFLIIFKFFKTYFKQLVEFDMENFISCELYLWEPFWKLKNFFSLTLSLFQRRGHKMI